MLKLNSDDILKASQTCFHWINLVYEGSLNICLSTFTFGSGSPDEGNASNF